MKNLLSVLALLLPGSLFAQVLDRQVIASTGNSTSTGTVIVSSTVGEVITASASTATVILSQGFQQADPVSIGIEELEFGLAVTAFPNPSTDAIQLDISAEKNITIQVSLVDISGKEVIPVEELKVTEKLHHTLHLSSLAIGHYFIRLTNSDGTLNRSIPVQKMY